MKRKVALNLTILIFTLLLFFNNQAIASIDIPVDSNGKTYYGWVLGKLDPTTGAFVPSYTDTFTWYYTPTTTLQIRPCGPWTVYVNGQVEGTIVNFVDKNSSSNNGYPMVEDDKWDAWINLFGGNSTFVKQNLKSWNIGAYRFANMSQLAELSGGEGVLYQPWKSYISYLKSTGPTASITPTRYSCKVGESITFNLSATNKALSYHFVDMTFKDDKGMTYINNEKYLTDNASDKVTKTFTAPGNYLFTLTVNDGVFRYTTKQMLISVSNNPIDPVQPPDPPPVTPPTPPAAENLPPTAVFSLPSTCYEGDTVDVSESSFDLDGQVVDWTWKRDPDFIGTFNLAKGGGTISTDYIGTYNTTLTVTDDDGATDTVSHSIEVKPAKPVAVISYSGTLKENRKVTLYSSMSKSSERYPIDHTRDEWTITPVTGGTSADVKYGTRLGSNQDMLFKKEGVYRVGLRVHNAKYDSDWAYKDIVIGPDVAPLVNFFKSAIAFRNPSDANKATITLNDRSYSLDNDNISQRIWKYKFDSDNDGSFLDETWTVQDSGNNTKVTFKANHVGKYLFELEVKESFGQPTIPTFVTDADYRRGDTNTKPQADKITDVQNIAPVTSFSVTTKPKVDIVFSQGFLNDYKTRFPNMVANLESIVGSKLAAKNIDYSFYNTTTFNSNIEVLHGWAKGVAPYNNSDYTGTYSYLMSSGVTGWRDQITFDLGKQVDKSTVFDMHFRVKGTLDVLYIMVSNDNINYYPVITKLGQSGYYVAPYDAYLYCDKTAIPIQNFRYIRFHPDHSKGMDDFQYWVTLGTPDKTIDRTDTYVGGAESRAIDLGKTVNRDSIVHWEFFHTYPYWTYTYNVYVSPDNINWYYVCTNDDEWYEMQIHWLTVKEQIPVDNFRYVRYDYTGAHNTPIRIIIYTEPSTHATLADLQTKAATTYTADATKYIISLAEEPYTDANATTLSNTAYTINSSKANLVVFSDAANVTSAQQLTSKVNNQKIITTTYDMATPLSQLADYIISTSSSSTLSGFITLLLGQTIGYTPTYSDYENDPKVTDNWYYFHDPNFLDNNSGLSFYHNKTISGPVATLDKVGEYDVQYKAQDDPANTDLRFLNYRLWSDPAPTTIIIHRKPIADFSVQAGTVNVTDLSYDQDFQFRRPDKGVVQWLWKWRPVGSSVWTSGKPSGITALGTYVVHLEVKDVYGAWSDPAEKTITVTTLQRPPVADFNWTPTVIYEGDIVNLNNLSTDPDGDPLAYLWTVFNPLGGMTTFTTQNGIITNALPGTYWVTLRAADPGGMSDTVTKFFEVNKLGITGYVKHTDLWNSNRIKYNQHETGTNDSPRPYNIFWAGEKFILEASTTDTGISLTKAQNVKVDFPAYGLSANLTPNAAKTSWSGDMFRDDFENISDGTYAFRFTVTYSNGVVKVDDVQIAIRGAWTNYYKFHRNW